jgi:hypothetical protein
MDDNKILRLSGGPFGSGIVDIPLFKQTTDVITVKVLDGISAQIRIAKQPGDVEYWPSLLTGTSEFVRTHVDWDTWVDENDDLADEEMNLDFEYPSFHDVGDHPPPSNGEWTVPSSDEEEEDGDEEEDDEEDEDDEEEEEEEDEEEEEEHEDGCSCCSE